MIDAELLRAIEDHAERAYPEEGAGFLLGRAEDSARVLKILPVTNLGVEGARRTRYQIGADDYMRAEMSAEQTGMVLLGVFHSHPDHPEEPSDFDRDWAQPNLDYLITSVREGRAAATKGWRLSDDRTRFEEQRIELIDR